MPLQTVNPSNSRPVFTRPKDIRQRIHAAAITALQGKFPIKSGSYEVFAKDLAITPAEVAMNDQKLAILKRGNISDAVYGTLEVRDASGGLVVSIPKHRFMNIPLYTNRYTFLVDGNEYTISNQLRTKSGVYTRRKANEELESSFNLETGANFKLHMAPDTGVFKLDLKGSTISMYPILRILGATEGEVKSALGDALFAANAAISPTATDRALDTLYTRLVKTPVPLASKDEKLRAVLAYFEGTKIDPETTHATLGKAFTHVTAQTILAAAKKMLAVFKDEVPEDNRDELDFQKIFCVEDFVKEVINKNSNEFLKIKNKLASLKPGIPKDEARAALKSIFSASAMTKPIRDFIINSPISRLPSQINPLEFMDSSLLVTRLGEGAIPTEESVPDETRYVHGSYAGLIDPVATPESSKVGIDNRLAMMAVRGDDNELYKKVTNLKTGKPEYQRSIFLRDYKVGFPDPGHMAGKESPDDEIAAMYKGQRIMVKRKDLDYQIPSAHHLNTITIASLPFMNASQGNRAVMGAKHVQQALPLKYRDTRLVDMEIPFGDERKSIAEVAGSYMIPVSPVDGTVLAIDEDYIRIKGTDGKVYNVDYDHNTPLATKTLLKNTPLVKVGDKVKVDQKLTDSNFSKNGVLALGKNLEVAYMPYHGLNHEDGIVISDTTAKKLTSMHAHRTTIPLTKLNVANKEKYATYFSTKFSKAQLAKLDTDGVAKKGAVLEYGDPIAVLLEDSADSKKNQILGLIHKSLMTQYRDASVLSEEHYPVTVLDVEKTKSAISILTEYEKPAEVGDKLSGSYGNKGVISKILPEDQMIRNSDGKPVDAVLTSASVTGRVNPAQTLETALGKIAKKTGKPYRLENYGMPDYTAFVQKELDRHGISDKETVHDPITGKSIPGVMVGVQHMHKLFKTTDANFAGRGIDGAYDQDESPVGSGEIGPKALGGMEINALLAHNARDFLYDSTMLRSGKNMDFWRAFQHGHFPQMPTEKKTFTKFTSILRQAGVKVERKDNHLVAGPLTDRDILEHSHGEILDGKQLQSKDLRPEEGGLFDERLTGGLQGTKWTHVTLAEPMPNPVFEGPIKVLLDLSTAQFQDILKRDGGAKLKAMLDALDVGKELAKAAKEANDPSVKGLRLDKVVKKIQYLRALKENGMTAGEAYVLHHFPVLPPVLRPITVGKTGDTMSNDSNTLYKNLILQNNLVKENEKHGLVEKREDGRENLYTRVKEITGVIAPEDTMLKNKGVKGAIRFIAGDQPKTGFFQKKVIYNKMNLSGRGTIIPDVTLGLDEIGLPEEMAWSMYAPFIIRKLVAQGYSAIEAREAVDEKSDLAKKVLQEEMSERPVVANRAPSLWQYSLLGAKPVLRSGKSLHVNTLWEKGTNADHDGDAMQIHLPVTDKAIDDVKAMFPSKQVFTNKKKGDLYILPSNEPVIALFKVTANLGKGPVAGKVHKFASEADAWKAYYHGEVKATDLVEIGA